MIGRLRGYLIDKSVGRVVVEVGGVGYEVAVTPSTAAVLPAVGEDVVIHTHLHVREDLMALYGFGSTDERDLFRLLIGISGVGPKLAQAILATLSPAELRGVVLAEDGVALTAVPGIGKRSAQKLLLELRPKLDLPDVTVVGNSVVGEVREALEALGYQSVEIRDVLRNLPSDATVEVSLRGALQELGRKRV